MTLEERVEQIRQAVNAELAAASPDWQAQALANLLIPWLAVAEHQGEAQDAELADLARRVAALERAST